MAFNSFVVYETVGRRVRYLRQMQDQADADVVADADLSAHVGVVSTPDWVLPDHYFNPGDLSFTADAVLSELDQLKAAARTTHAQLEAWTGALNAAALTHLSAHVNYGHDILFRGHQAMYLVLQRNTGIYTFAHRITYCQNMAVGASDVTTVTGFFDHVHSVAAAHALPDRPLSWVNPLDNERLMFVRIPQDGHLFFIDSNDIEEIAPIPSVLRDGAWIEDLVA